MSTLSRCAFGIGDGRIPELIATRLALLLLQDTTSRRVLALDRRPSGLSGMRR